MPSAVEHALSGDGRRVWVVVSWLLLWSAAAACLVVHSDLGLLIVWAAWLVSGLVCVAVSRGHRIRAVLFVALSGIMAFNGFVVVLVFLSCITGHECGI